VAKHAQPSWHGVLEADFDAKTPRASLHILTNVADALRAHVNALRSVDVRPRQTQWIEMLSLLGEALESHLCKVEAVDEIKNVWQRFFSASEITKLPHLARRVLDEIDAASKHPRWDFARCVTRFRRVNRDGHALAKSVLATRGLGRLLGQRPAVLSIAWDPNASYYCAATTRADRRIRWAHQPVAHGLYAALVPELVFAHEYFSHLAPRSRQLSLTMMEVWLVEALLLSLEQSLPVERRWEIVVWRRLRGALTEARVPSSASAEVARSGYYGVGEFALLLFGRSPDAFWRLTQLVLTGPDSAADELDDVLLQLVSQQMWKKVSTAKWTTLDDLRRLARR
jgi:hypothetical protein